MSQKRRGEEINADPYHREDEPDDGSKQEDESEESKFLCLFLCHTILSFSKYMYIIQYSPKKWNTFFEFFHKKIYFFTL